MSKSLKQQWVFERLYSHEGSLRGMAVRLRRIASAESTLKEESDHLYDAAFAIQQIDLKKNKDLSWKKFKLLRQG